MGVYFNLEKPFWNLRQSAFTVKVFDKTYDHPVTEDDCFDMFNGGSGREDADYFNGSRRSLSVGDVLVINGKVFACDSFGWRELNGSSILEAV